MPEAVRLVVWDLDETFWRGTLTEGGIEYQRRNHDAVVTLARRGIMSSICSKNDMAAVRDILVANDIWDHFIFPSIDWQPKGARLARLIETIQLRPASVMFIDDHPRDRNEAMQRIPDLQVADETFIDAMLDDARFRGEDDHALRRLAHYKLLERRHEDRQAHDDNTAFLRGSGITVTVAFDIEPHVDRAVELINRTNQLNFTKRRLPEDAVTARETLLAALRQSNVQAGLIKVTDRYGDYGFVGFYLLHVHMGWLEHYCFSCRTLGMGVEVWLYERLRRPSLHVEGHVLTDLHAPARPVDWINTGPLQARQGGKRLGRVLVRGGCEMQALAHFLGLDAVAVVGEFGFERDGMPVAASHSVFLRAAFDGVPQAALAAAASIGLRPADFRSAAADSEPFDLYIHSFWADAHFALYEHPDSGLMVPFGLNHFNNGKDLRLASAEELVEKGCSEASRRFASALRDGFEYRGWSPGIPAGESEGLLEQNLRRIFAATPAARPVVVVLACEALPLPDGGTDRVFHLAELNRQTRRAAAGFPNVHLLPVEPFFHGPEDAHNATHFSRTVYHRIYRHIVEWYAAMTSSP